MPVSLQRTPRAPKARGNRGSEQSSSEVDGCQCISVDRSMSCGGSSARQVDGSGQHQHRHGGAPWTESASTGSMSRGGISVGKIDGSISIGKLNGCVHTHQLCE